MSGVSLEGREIRKGATSAIEEYVQAQGGAYPESLRLEVDRLRFVPCLPESWKTFKLHYRYRETSYHITYRHSGKTVTGVSLDGVEQQDKSVPLLDDKVEHVVEVRMDA